MGRVSVGQVHRQGPQRDAASALCLSGRISRLGAKGKPILALTA